MSKSVILWFKKTCGCGSATRRRSEDLDTTIIPQKLRYACLVAKKNINYTPDQITSDINNATLDYLRELFLGDNNIGLDE